MKTNTEAMDRLEDVRKALMEFGRMTELSQRHRAEAMKARKDVEEVIEYLQKLGK
jgi:hypothetical protein